MLRYKLPQTKTVPTPVGVTCEEPVSNMRTSALLNKTNNQEEEDREVETWSQVEVSQVGLTVMKNYG